MIKKGDKVLINDEKEKPFEAIVLAVLENNTVVCSKKDNVFKPIQVGLNWVTKIDA